MSFGIIKDIRNRVNHKLTLKDTMEINKFHGFVNIWNFDKMVFMITLRIDIQGRRKC